MTPYPEITQCCLPHYILPLIPFLQVVLEGPSPLDPPTIHKQHSVVKVILWGFGTSQNEFTRMGHGFIPSLLPVLLLPQARRNPPSPEIQRLSVGWTNRYTFGYLVWRKCNYSIQEEAMSGFLTLSPTGPTFPVTPGSPYRKKYITSHSITKMNSAFVILEKGKKKSYGYCLYSP